MRPFLLLAFAIILGLCFGIFWSILMIGFPIDWTDALLRIGVLYFLISMQLFILFLIKVFKK